MKQRYSFQKIAPALAVVCLSLGGLLWRLDHFRAERAAKAAEKAKAAEDAIRAKNPEALIDFQAAHAPLRMAVATVVRGHLNAIKRQDYAAATAFFGERLRKKFSDPNALRTMLQETESPLARVKTLKFVFVNTDVNTFPWHQKSHAGVHITTEESVGVDVVFHLALEKRIWRITGITTQNPLAKTTGQ